VIVRGRIVVPMVLAALMLGEFAPEAQAMFGRHKSSQSRTMRRPKKNTSPYAYLAPKKQKKPNGWYRSTVTGEMVYGKPGKVKKKK
jgi:hypothetical protein